MRPTSHRVSFCTWRPSTLRHGIVKDLLNHLGCNYCWLSNRVSVLLKKILIFFTRYGSLSTMVRQKDDQQYSAAIKPNRQYVEQQSDDRQKLFSFDPRHTQHFQTH